MLHFVAFIYFFSYLTNQINIHKNAAATI